MTAQLNDATSQQRLENFPVTFFAVGMGMMGFSLALRAAETSFVTGHAASQLVLALSAIILLAVLASYLAKAVRYPSHVVAEWHHPVKVAFFPAVSISFLLLAIALVEVAPDAAHWVWLLATALQGVLSLAVISTWIGHRPFTSVMMTPAWFIPAVGNVIVPIAGAQFGYEELSWLFFSAGLIFWVILLTLVMNRLMFHDPMPAKMVPTLMILVAPPAAAFVAWLRLEGEPGAFGHFLISTAYVFALLVATQALKLRRLPFALSWWALSFPLAALSLASFAFAHATASNVHRFIGLGLLALLALVVIGLVLRTMKAIRNLEICVPE